MTTHPNENAKLFYGQRKLQHGKYDYVDFRVRDYLLTLLQQTQPDDVVRFTTNDVTRALGFSWPHRGPEASRVSHCLQAMATARILAADTRAKHKRRHYQITARGLQWLGDQVTDPIVKPPSLQQQWRWITKTMDDTPSQQQDGLLALATQLADEMASLRRVSETFDRFLVLLLGNGRK